MKMYVDIYVDIYDYFKLFFFLRKVLTLILLRLYTYGFNSLSASLLLNIFLSFEVGIAHAIANFK